MRLKLAVKEEGFMNQISKTLLALIILSFAGSSQAQQNLVNLSISVPQYNQIYVADLDIQHAQSTGVLFSAALKSLAPTEIHIKLTLSVVITLVGQAPFQIAQATSTPLTLEPGQMKVITNVDLSGDNPPIHLESYSYDQEQFDKIKNVALATGKAPAGTYAFMLNCVNESNIPVSNPAQGQIVVTNPSRIDLVLPMDGGNITTLFPHFQWSANVDSVVLSVYQKLPNQAGPQDVVSGVPFLQQSVVGGSFNYPPSGPGVRLLATGQTYYWFVDIPSSATRGAGLRSDIWSFTVSGTDTTSGNSANWNDVATKALINLLTGTQYQGLLSQISSLNGTASFDGSSIGTQDLIDILQGLDKSKIINVTIQ